MGDPNDLLSAALSEAGLDEFVHEDVPSTSSNGGHMPGRVEEHPSTSNSQNLVRAVVHNQSVPPPPILLRQCRRVPIPTPVPIPPDQRRIQMVARFPPSHHAQPGVPVQQQRPAHSFIHLQGLQHQRRSVQVPPNALHRLRVIDQFVFLSIGALY
jgi:hypothetical protein